MFKDFRDYLGYLESKGKLLRVKKEVDTHYDIAAGVRKISDIDGPALLFENVKGFPGAKVVGGLFGTQKLIALALGLPLDASEDRIVQRYLEFDQKRVEPKVVKTGPVKEVIFKGDDIDLTKFPVLTYAALDSGPYITSGVEIGRNHKTGVQNCSIHRRQLLGKNRTGVFAVGTQHLGMLIAAAEKEGKGLEIATVIGAPPELTIAAIVEAPEGVDEAYIAGGLHGEPLEVVKCETIDVMVPANAEIIIEGVTIPKERVVDGPFGEFPGNYITLCNEPTSNFPVVQVTAVTMRKNPILETLMTGMPMTENHYLKKWALAAAAYRQLEGVADVKAANMTRGGAGYHLVVAIQKKDDSEPKKVIEAISKLRHGAKYIIVVDDDINVYDPFEVEWAMATRMKAHLDTVVIPPVITDSGTMGSKLGIDATAPLKDKKWYQKVVNPGVDKVDYV